MVLKMNSAGGPLGSCLTSSVPLPLRRAGLLPLNRPDIGGSRAVIHEEVQEAGDTDVLRGRRTEEREHVAVADTGTQAFAHFAVAQPPFFQVIVEQVLIGLRDELEHLLAQLLGTRLRFLGDVLFGVLAAPARSELQQLHPDHVDDAVEAEPSVERKLQGEDIMAERLTRLGEDLVEIGVLLIELVHQVDDRVLALGCVAGDDLRSHFHSFDGFQQHDRGVGDPQRRDHFAGEIGISRSVQDIGLDALPFAEEE